MNNTHQNQSEYCEYCGNIVITTIDCCGTYICQSCYKETQEESE